MTRRVAAAAALALCMAVAAGIGPASAAPAAEVNLKEVAHLAVGGVARYDDVAVVGTTGVVTSASGECGPAPAVVVDLQDPRRPKVASIVALPGGLSAVDVDAAALATPVFTGDLAAIAVRSCDAGGSGSAVLYYDVSDPRAPRLLAQAPAGGDLRTVSIASRGDGRVLTAIASGRGTGAGLGGAEVELHDVTDPAHPTGLARWTRPAEERPPGGCPVLATSAELEEAGDRVVVTFSDGAVYELGSAEGQPLIPVGSTPPGEAGANAVYAAAAPVGGRTLAVVSEEDGPAEGACAAGAAGRGIRLLRLTPPTDVGQVRYPSAAPPGRLVVSGELAFVAWHGDGLRVLDVGQVRPATTARFLPATAAPDVVGVALLASSVVVVDADAGLYVLVRPDEGRKESFWSKVKASLGYIGFGGVLIGAMTVPRLASRGAAARSRSRVPSPAPVPRR